MHAALPPHQARPPQLLRALLSAVGVESGRVPESASGRLDTSSLHASKLRIPAHPEMVPSTTIPGASACSQVVLCGGQSPPRRLRPCPSHILVSLLPHAYQSPCPRPPGIIPMSCLPLSVPLGPGAAGWKLTCPSWYNRVMWDLQSPQLCIPNSLPQGAPGWGGGVLQASGHPLLGAVSLQEGARWEEPNPLHSPVHSRPQRPSCIATHGP